MAIEYKTLTYRTVESTNDNATYCWVELSAFHVPAVNGLIKRIVIQGATNGNTGFTLEPMYLGIWERQDDGGLIFLGCSKNAVTQSINQQNIWDFDGATVRGKALLLGLLSAPDEHWTNNTSLLLRSSVQTNDTDGCVILTDIGRIRVTPDITFTVDVPEVIPDEEPEPQPESEEHRIVDISKYWIQIIRNTNEFKQIAIAENPEFNGLLDAIYRALKDGFILEATDYGVSRWERLLKLVVTEDMTLDDRKVQILTYLSVKLPYTWRVLKQMLTEYLGEGNFRMSIDNDTQTFHMSLTAGAMSKLNDIDQLLKRVLPTDLVIEYDDIPMDYTLLEYLESSGTQNIAVPAPYLETTKERWNVETDMQFLTVPTTDTTSAKFGFNNRGGLSWGLYYNNTIGVSKTLTGYQISVDEPLNRYIIVYSTKAISADRWNITLAVNGKKISRNADNGAVPTEYKYGIFKTFYESTASNTKPIRVWSCKCWCDSVSYDLVPMLDADDFPGMWDKVNKQFFKNSGTGSFGYRVKVTGIVVIPLDLDDPYYTAPSGVWAKLIDENTLDIITALDPTVDESQGYKLFANVGDAYQYFNIKEVIENE